MRWGIAGATGALGMLVSTVAGAQEVQAPQWRVGTTCTFAFEEMYVAGSRVNRSLDYTQTVKAVSGQNVQLDFTSKRGSTVFTWTAEGNLVSNGQTTYSPAFPTYSFPMTVGKSWSSKFTAQAGGKSFPYEATSKVVAWENINVEGKVYAAAKIQVDGRYYNPTEGKYGNFKQTVWYAPTVNRAVKEEYWHGALSGATWYQEEKRLKGCGN